MGDKAISRTRFVKEAKKYWKVDVANIPVADYGWGFVKLEALFLNNGEKFLVVDADTIMSGKVLDESTNSTASFVVDKEHLPDADLKRLYYDWDALKQIDPQVQPARAAFNVGQWFGTGRLIKRDEFDALVEWTFPRKLKSPHLFMGGDQGVLNYVVLKKEILEGLAIDRNTIMRWPANGMDDLTPDKIESGSAPAMIVHWAGMKKVRISKMAGSNLLQFFEKVYYTNIPNAKFLWLKDVIVHHYLQWQQLISVRVRLTLQKYFGKKELDYEKKIL
jgi:hypothetical protein